MKYLVCHVESGNTILHWLPETSNKKKKKKTCVDWGKAQREKMNKYNSLSSGKIES